MDIHYKISTHPVLGSEERKTVRMQSTGLLLRKFTPICSSRNLNLGKLSVSLERICSMDISHSFWLKAWHNKHCFQSQRTIIVTQRDFLQFCEKFMLLVTKKSSFKNAFSFWIISLDSMKLHWILIESYIWIIHIVVIYFHAGIMTINFHN